MRFIFLICFLLALPPLAAGGHDAYMAYVESQEGNVDLSEPFRFSDLGWLWVTYAPQNYDWMRGSMNPDMWKSMIEPALTQPAIVVTAIPALALYILLGVLRIIGLPPFTGRGIMGPQKARGAAPARFDDKRKTKGRWKYKRK